MEMSLPWFLARQQHTPRPGLVGTVARPWYGSGCCFPSRFRCGGLVFPRLSFPLGRPVSLLVLLTCQCQSVSVCPPDPSASLPPAICDSAIWLAPSPPFPHPMQCCDCRIALVDFGFFTRLLAS